MKQNKINGAECKSRASKKFFRAAAFISIALAALFALPCLPVHGEAEIYGKVLRLHVIAASDSEEDQSIKLSVRDALLKVIPELLGDCRTLEEAVAAAEDGSERLLSTARGELSRLGAEYGASLTLGEEYYPTREYDGLRLPAGRYTSLRVVLGDGQGKNWWCVLFPSLCLSAAKRSTVKAECADSTSVAAENAAASANDEREEDYIAAGFTPEQYRTITETDTPKYKIRFKILELIGELFGKGPEN